MKLIRKITSILLVLTLVTTSVRLDFPLVTEFNETISVDETMQLVIPGGATSVKWETESKRIAKVSSDGKVTGVKVGTCDISCRAEYSKFLIFKDIVNYVFHIRVVDSRDVSYATSSFDASSYNDDNCIVYYELFLNSDVANIDLWKPDIVKKGEKLSNKGIPMSNLCTFRDWYTDIEGKNKFDFNSVIEDSMVLYALWSVDETDTDGDGLLDVIEKNKYKTSIYEKDTDQDGLSDFIEVKYGLNPLTKDSNGNGINDFDDDLDGDELSNGDELKYNTELNIPDTDSDKLLDGEEIKVYHTDALLKDTDGDNATDGWEVENGFDPTSYNSTFNVTKLSGDISEANPVTCELDMELSGGQVETLTIAPVKVTDTYLASPTVPGYMGYMYDLEVDGTFDQANLTFNYDTNKFGAQNSTFAPRIYYVNEENGTYEELPNQKVENGKITATINHFSKYILLNKIEFDEIWNADIKYQSTASSKSNIGMDIAIVLDSSGSMGSNDPNNVRIDLGNKIVDKLSNNDRASIIDFDSKANILSSLSSNKANLKSKLKSIDSNGGTSLSAGLKAGIESLSNSPDEKYKTIFFLTDGEGGSADNEVRDAMNKGIIINTVGLGKGVDEAILRKIASETGGNYYYAEIGDELLKVAEEYIDLTTDSNNDGIVDYYTELMKYGKLFVPGYPLGIDLNEHGDDYDGDGLKNGEEIIISENPNEPGKPYVSLKSNPFIIDTDYDGFSDLEERNQNSNSSKFDKRKDQLDYFSNITDNTYKSYKKESPILDVIKRLGVGADTIVISYCKVLTNYFTEYCDNAYLYEYNRLQNEVIQDTAEQIAASMNMEYRKAVANNDIEHLNAIKNVNDQIGLILSSKDMAEFANDIFGGDIGNLLDSTIRSATGVSKDLKLALQIKDCMNTMSIVTDVIDSVIDLKTTTSEELQRYYALVSNSKLIDNNMQILKSLKSYGEKNDKDMSTAASIIIEEAHATMASWLPNSIINNGRKLGKKIGLKALSNISGVPLDAIITVLVTIVDIRNKYDTTKQAFWRLSTVDRYNEYGQFLGIVDMHKTAVLILNSSAKSKGGYYVFGDDPKSNKSTNIQDANTFAMFIAFLIQTRVLLKKNICSIEHNRISSEFNLAVAKKIINELRVHINENFLMSNLPNLQFVQGK